MTSAERFRTWFLIGAWFATSTLMYGYHYNRADDCEIHILRPLKNSCRNAHGIYWAVAWPVHIPLIVIGEIAVRVTKPATEPQP